MNFFDACHLRICSGKAAVKTPRCEASDGQIFMGLSANSVICKLTTVPAMLVGQFALAIPALSPGAQLERAGAYKIDTPSSQLPYLPPANFFHARGSGGDRCGPGTAGQGSDGNTYSDRRMGRGTGIHDLGSDSIPAREGGEADGRRGRPRRLVRRAGRAGAAETQRLTAWVPMS